MAASHQDSAAREESSRVLFPAHQHIVRDGEGTRRGIVYFGMREAPSPSPTSPPAIKTLPVGSNVAVGPV